MSDAVHNVYVITMSLLNFKKTVKWIGSFLLRNRDNMMLIINIRHPNEISALLCVFLIMNDNKNYRNNIIMDPTDLSIVDH